MRRAVGPEAPPNPRRNRRRRVPYLPARRQLPDRPNNNGRRRLHHQLPRRKVIFRDAAQAPAVVEIRMLPHLPTAPWPWHETLPLPGAISFSLIRPSASVHGPSLNGTLEYWRTSRPSTEKVTRSAPESYSISK